jgi:hypothetical protein
MVNVYPKAIVDVVSVHSRTMATIAVKVRRAQQCADERTMSIAVTDNVEMVFVNVIQVTQEHDVIFRVC